VEAKPTGSQRVQNCVHLVCGVLFQRRQYVAVEVRGRAEAGVSEDLLNDLHRHALPQEQRGRTMAQVVEANPEARFSR